MSGKKVLVIGGGGREHALTWKLAQSPHIEKIFVAPGNPGMLRAQGSGLRGSSYFAEVENVDIPVSDFSKLAHLAYSEDIYLTVVGPDDPLAEGIVDSFQAKGLRIFGPSQAAAQIEASKAFSKDFMRDNNIPTAIYKTFTVDDNAEQVYDQALAYIQKQKLPIVIKASGLALGKGVIIAHDLSEAKAALNKILIDKAFGEAGNQIVIEEYLEGHEISIHAFSDGHCASLLPTAQDHKAIYEGDRGPNTGGMGTIAPLPKICHEKMDAINHSIVKPAIWGMKSAGRPFTGLLYPGLKITDSGPKVLEFNARFGDPETQVYMRLLKTDLFEIIEACIDGKLSEKVIEWEYKSAACIVLASGGYPGKYEKGFKITGIEEAEADPNIVVFQAGTKIQDGELVTNGGRVLGVTALGDNLEQALAAAYEAVDKIDFKGKYFRKDIGAKTLKESLVKV